MLFTCTVQGGHTEGGRMTSPHFPRQYPSSHRTAGGPWSPSVPLGGLSRAAPHPNPTAIWTSSGRAQALAQSAGHGRRGGCRSPQRTNQAFTAPQPAPPTGLNSFFTAGLAHWILPQPGTGSSRFPTPLYLKFVAIELFGAVLHRSLFYSPEFFLSRGYTLLYTFFHYFFWA